nr:phage portal protein [Nitrospirillum amazonense]
MDIGRPTDSGVPVSPETAMRNTAVYGCVRVLAETLAQLPCSIYRRTEGDGGDEATDHPLHPLLTSAANEWTPAAEFRQQLQTYLSTYGNAYAYANRGADGAVAELLVLKPTQVAIEVDQVTQEPLYIFSNLAGQQTKVSRRDMVHLRTIGLETYRGDSPITAAREAIGLGLVLERYGAGLFGRGARPSGLLKYGKKMGDDLLGRLRRSFQGFYGGGDNAGRTLILEDGVEFQPLQLNSTDAQYLELRKFQIQEIARVWRVPLHLIADLERITYSNAEILGSQFLTFCILPLVRIWVDSLSLTLLTPEERKTLYIAFDTDSIARADMAARFASYSQAITSGVLNPNEARRLEGRAPYAGGDEFVRAVNVAPTPSAGPATPAANIPEATNGTP